MTNIVAIQNISTATKLVQLLFHGVGQAGFSRTGQARKPQNHTFMTILLLSAISGNGGIMPDDVVAIGLFIRHNLGFPFLKGLKIKYKIHTTGHIPFFSS